MKTEKKIADKNEYRLIAYIGESCGGQGYTEMEFNPYEYAVIFRDSENNEIWLDPDCMVEMSEQLKEYVKRLKPFLTLQ